MSASASTMTAASTTLPPPISSPEALTASSDAGPAAAMTTNLGGSGGRARAVTTPVLQRDVDLPPSTTVESLPPAIAVAEEETTTTGTTRSRSKTQPDAVLYASRERGESDASLPAAKETLQVDSVSRSRANSNASQSGTTTRPVATRNRAESQASVVTTTTTATTIAGEGGEEGPGDCVPTKRVKEWKKHFEGNMKEGEELVCTHGCALVVDIMLHGRVYISNRSVAFRSNIVGWITKRHFSLDDISRIEPRVVAGFIPNALAIIHKDGKETLLTTLPDREHTMKRLMDVWEEASPEDFEKWQATRADDEQQGGDEEAQAVEEEKGGGEASSADTPDLEKVALTTTFAAAPDKIYSLMYHHPAFISDIWKSQGFRDIKVDEWDDSKHRHSSYTKPIGGNVGSTTVVNDEEIIHPDDQDEWYAVVGVTSTPNVPSGKSFSTKSKTVFTRTSSGGTRMRCTYQIEWTGKSMLKGMINGQAEKGQVEWNKLLAEKIREYVEQHPEERVGKEEHEDEDEAEASAGATATTSTQDPQGGEVIAEWLTSDPIRGAMAVALLAISLLYLWTYLSSLLFRAKTVCIPYDRWKAYEAYEAYERLRDGST